MQDVEAAIERRAVCGIRGGGDMRGGGVGVTEEHEDVPDAELRWERDGVVEEGQVPAGAVGGGGDAEFGLWITKCQ